MLVGDKLELHYSVKSALATRKYGTRIRGGRAREQQVQRVSEGGTYSASSCAMKGKNRRRTGDDLDDLGGGGGGRR